MAPSGIDAPSVRGARLGVDVGDVRIGIALSDPDGILATPFMTVARDARALGSFRHFVHCGNMGLLCRVEQPRRDKIGGRKAVLSPVRK